MLKDRIAIVTGGGAGIGEAIVRRFSDEGAAVAIFDRDVDRAEEVAASLPGRDVLCVRCDVSVEAEVARAAAAVLDRYGRVDILVNNAGIPPTSVPLDEFPEEDWDEMAGSTERGTLRSPGG